MSGIHLSVAQSTVLASAGGRLVTVLVTVVAALAIPFFVTLTSARVVISSDVLYGWGFDAFSIERQTGIAQSDLMEASRDIRRYFEDGRERLDTSVIKDGESFDLFNEREELHMVDVKVQVQTVYAVQTGSGLLLAAVALIAAFYRPARRSLAMGVVAGGVTILAVMLAIGVGAATSFDALFLLFHQLSFTNDLWLLDPRTDYLIKLFPQGFFLGATAAIGGLTAVSAVGLSWIAWRARGR